MTKDAPNPDTICPLIESGGDLEKTIRESERMFILFYAAWCPFSRMFLPAFIEQAAKGEPCYRRILADEDEALTRRYGIEVFPTVLFFRNGKVERRLDGAYHIGLSRGQLEEFISLCGR